MKTFLLTAVALALVTGTAVGPATAAPPAEPASVDAHCVPGMTAPTAGACSLPGFHWALTTVYEHHGAQSRWMLLPNG